MRTFQCVVLRDRSLCHKSIALIESQPSDAIDLAVTELTRDRTSMGANVLCASFAVATHPQHQFEHYVHHAHDDAADDGPAQPVNLQTPVR